MSPATVLETEVQALPARSVEETPPGRSNAREQWLHKHLNLAAFGVVAAAFFVRLVTASGTFLNGDEALHYALINQHSVFLAYKATLTNAHPPLMYFLIYYWHFLGRSELMLRLPIVLLGTGFCWFLFKWVETAAGKTAGVTSLIVAAFCPALVSISAEVREYSPLLFFVAVALFLLEQAFRKLDTRWMWGFSIALYSAILSHYSAIFVCGALGLYALVRMVDARPSRKFVLAWAGGQAGATALYGFLYVTHVSKLKDSIAVWDQPYRAGHYHPLERDLAEFTQAQTSSIFSYLFQQTNVGQAMLFFFLAGVALLFVKGSLERKSFPRHFAILLFLPILLLWGGGVTGIYPYSGSRHTIVLAPFTIAAASIFLATIARHRLSPAILFAVLLVTASNVSGSPKQPFITRANQDRNLMLSAMSEIQRSIPPGAPILMDFHSSLLARFYLCDRSAIIPFDGTSRNDFETFSCAGHTIISLPSKYWKLTSGTFAPQFEKMTRGYGLRSGDRVWVFQSGWGMNLDATLPQYLPKYRCLTATRFGENISIIPFIVNSDYSPAVPDAACKN
jgi:uncharacterized membrane protein